MYDYIYMIKFITFRLDPWATYVLPTPRNIYDHHFWNPPPEQVYKFRSSKPKRPASLKVIFTAIKNIFCLLQKFTTYSDVTFTFLFCYRSMSAMLEYLQATRK